MADQLGKLRARLEADSSGFTSGMRKAAAEAKSFSKIAGSALSSVKSAFGGLTGLIAGGAFAASIKSSLDELDRIDELSSTFGLATADLQRLSLIATQSGVDMEGLAKATTKLYKTLASNPDAFSELGLSAETLSAVDLPTKLGMIGDALNKVEGDEQRVAAAMELFGKSGAELLPLLQSGLEGISAAAGEVKIFTDDDIAKAVAANDALDRASKSLKSIITDLTVSLAPAIEELANFVASIAGPLKWVQDNIGAPLGRFAQATTEVGSLFGPQVAPGVPRRGAGLNASQPYSAGDIAEFRRIREASERTADNLQAAGLAY